MWLEEVPTDEYSQALDRSRVTYEDWDFGYFFAARRLHPPARVATRAYRLREFALRCWRVGETGVWARGCTIKSVLEKGLRDTRARYSALELDTSSFRFGYAF